ncbi:E3 ubiquitin-protein ligase TRIM39-like [Protopterus annectens]|uniref:E3 ubiquitin-protein ligase TRIM39-like n=1 Tax=Protopterus annectens TaxID=7888 RepID=UPI001CF9EC4A|nr:E3 ubiquitin-protein ligase TRIM39-like [Protopterus annectens]
MQNLCVTNGSTEQCCGEHRRRLELFCQEDEAFICVLCVPRHSGHSFVFLHEAVSVYKDKLKTSLSSLELKVRDLKDLQTKNETEFLEIQEHAVNLEKYIAEEFVKLHQFLHDKEQKLIQQLNSKASEILREIKENLECIKTDITEIHSAAVYDTNFQIKTEVEVLEVLEERNDDTDDLTTTEESVSGDTSEHGKHKPNGVLSAPESFEDVAVTFSAEEMKMLTKQDKELHKEVMLENYETLVSAGYKIPPEALLVLLKEDNPELAVSDKEGINRTEQKNNFKEKPDSNGSREWSICWSQQPSLGVSVSHYPTENVILLYL